MRPQASSSSSTALLAAASLATLACAHSWVEEVYRIAPSGALVGDIGYPRGWVARTSTDPVWKDAIPQNLLPPAGQSAYSGDEIINKYDFSESPAFPMLQAAPGDHVALIHLENGHTSLPQNQPKKPRNRGTIFIYGTADPKPKERLFDVHLAWNRAGTGGDKRGRLLATRNYDDGQCYQPNPGDISNERAKALAADGASHDRELRCQSDIQLPDDLKSGSTYTLYWYWDWPDLDAAHIDMDATKNGIFPWAGTFMRGETDPHGFPMAAIAKNESYSSAVDIKIVDRAKLPGGAAAKAAGDGSGWQPGDIYTQAIKAQMTGNFQVDIDGNQAPSGGGGNSKHTQAGEMSSALSLPPTAAPTTTPTDGPGDGSGAVTVTKTVTVPPTTVFSTVYVTNSAAHSSPTGPTPPAVYATSMHPSSSSPTAPADGCDSASQRPTDAAQRRDMDPMITLPVLGRAARRNWQFGQQE
ncbi:hypothetical protein V2A60_007665 [Cordyceps javanica]